jgi:hypothetical protein
LAEAASPPAVMLHHKRPLPRRAGWLAEAGVSALGLMLAVVVSSCGPLEPDDVPGVVWEPDAKPRVLDDAGVVDDWRFHLSRKPGLSRLDARLDEESGEVANATNPPPPGWDLRVVWLSGPCGLSPTVRIEGSAGRITRISVEDPVVLPPDDPTVVCPAIGQVHAVDLKLSVEPPGHVPVRLILAGCHIAPYGVTLSPLPGCPDQEVRGRVP